MRKHRKRNYNKLIFSIIICLFLTMTIAYSSFSTNINITIKGNILERITTPTSLKKEIVSTGDGLYSDIYEENRYIYRGKNPNNYMIFDNSLWRIVSVENDNTLKIVKEESIGKFQFDDNERYSENENDYCVTSTGCNLWSSKTTTLDENNIAIDKMLNFEENGYVNLPDKEAALNVYLNSTYINSINEDKAYINTHLFNIGVSPDSTPINILKENERSNKWRGKVGLLSSSDYLYASLNNECLISHNAECADMNYLCHNNFSIFINRVYNGTKDTYSNGIRYLNADGYFNLRSWSPNDYFEVYPVVYLTANIKLIGNGTSTAPYKTKSL